jgi:hypothetical protein
MPKPLRSHPHESRGNDRAFEGERPVEEVAASSLLDAPGLRPFVSSCGIESQHLVESPSVRAWRAGDIIHRRGLVTDRYFRVADRARILAMHAQGKRTRLGHVAAMELP